ncbi:MAG TPA: GAF domain-containing protein [bacterium]|nr:GAF domain-containing protein [bacterium]
MLKPNNLTDQAKYFRTWGVRTKLLLSYVLLIVITTGVFFWITYSYTSKMAGDHMSQKIELLANVFSYQMKNNFALAVKSVEDTASDRMIRNLDENTIFRLYVSEHIENNALDAIFVYDLKGNLYYVNYYTDRAYTPKVDLFSLEQIQSAIHKLRTEIFIIDCDKVKPGTVLIAAPIIKNNNKVSGIVIGEKILDTTSMDKITKSHNKKGDSSVYLIDANGKILTHTEPELTSCNIFSEGMLLNEFADRKENLDVLFSDTFNFTFNGKKLFGTAALVSPKLGWRIIITQSYDSAIAQVRKISRRIILLGLLALAVAIYLALYRSYRITKPISDLIKAVEEISQGDYSKRVYVQRRDEFGWLAIAFNRMSQDLQEKIKALQESQGQLEEAFNQLQADSQKREQANRDLSMKVKELTSLSEVTHTISTTLDIDDVLDTIVDSIRNVMGFQKCSVKLLDSMTQTLKVRVSRGLGDEYLGKDTTHLGEGISGLAAKSRKIVVIEDVNSDERVPQDHILRKLGIKSVICIPLITKQAVMGVLNLYTEKSHEFTEDEKRLLGIFANQAASAIENARLFDSLRDSYLNTIQALSMAIDAKDRYTHGHSQRVSEISMMIGREMGLKADSLELLEYAADLHDIGKIGISEVIIGKKTKLTVDEYEIIKTHPLVGETIIEPVPFLQDARPVIRHHHERYDGFGYPDGLKGQEIPLLARIIHIADAYDAMTSDRPYRRALSHEDAIEEVKKHSGTQFDPKVVQSFLRIFDSGSLQ